MENEIIKRDNIYESRYYCYNTKQCRINKGLRIKYLIEKYNLKDYSKLRIVLNYTNVKDICLCGNEIKNVYIIELKDKYNNKVYFKLGNTCILEFNEGDDLIKKYNRKTIDCSFCNAKFIKKTDLINGHHNCFYQCKTCNIYTFKYSLVNNKYLLHKCFYKVCSCCKLNRHPVKYFKCFHCYQN